jgi:cytochrome c oxidase subunit 4
MNEHKHEHIIPLRTYLMIGGTLFILTATTVAVSFVHLGAFNLVIAMLIASVKAILVALFFMHLLYDNKLFMAIFSIALIFVSVFIILTMFDTLQRDSVDEVKSKPIKEAIIYEK